MGKRLNTGSPRVAVAYVRASKDEQKLTLEGQRHAIEGWASREGVTIAAWHVDAGVCSVDAIDDREALPAALAALRAHGAGLLLVAKRDRIARDPVLTAMVERAVAKAGAQVVSAAGEGNGSSPADQFMRGVIDCAAQYERAQIRSRTTAALAVIRASGRKTGGSVPFGFTLADDARTLVPLASEQAVIARARELQASGLSLRAIGAALASEGHVSRTGRPFAAAQVARMVEAQRTAA